jgi:hypothetical protein
MRKFITEPKRNLTAKIAHGEGQTLLRETLLVAGHNAYHLGQLHAPCLGMQGEAILGGGVCERM